MPVFDILCLANSKKMRGSCIAGLRMDGGGWVRPVAPTQHGELHPGHYRLQDGSCPRLLDRIRISFIERKPSAHQPENWLIADQPWRLISRGSSTEFAPLLQAHLTPGPALFETYSHKVSCNRFKTEPAKASLCLVRPADLRWKIEQHPYNSHKPSALFRLAGTSYRLSVTDPSWLDAFRAMTPGEYPAAAYGVASGLDVLFTISLGDPWEDENCYKLVAGILAMEPNLLSVPPESPKTPDHPMNATEAARIIQALADGRDPYTNRSLPHSTPLSEPKTVMALRAAAVALRDGRGKIPRALPAHAGRSWDSAEDELLVREFESGDSVASIARSHGRTRGAIQARLARLGMIDNRR